MNNSAFRGPSAQNELRLSQTARDVRRPGQIFKDTITGEFAPFTLLMCAVVMFVIPAIADYVFLVAVMMYSYIIRNQKGLFLKLPKHSGLLDPNEKHPKTKQPMLAKGTFYWGNENLGHNKKGFPISGGQIWSADPDVAQHIMMLATTGAGKTEALLSLAFNALMQNSGFIYGDGKAAVDVNIKITAMAILMGREDDLLTIDYSTGSKDISFNAQTEKVSNTLNPFAFGSSGSLLELMVSLMSASDGKGDMWRDRAIGLIAAIIGPLVWLRDNRGFYIDITVIRDYMNIPKILELRQIREMPDILKENLKGYCEGIPGWKENKKEAQSDDTLQQHGYNQMQFTKTVGSLSTEFGHIFRTPMGEVDMLDVMINRKILTFLIPQAEKSPENLAPLGKIIVASIKGMMALCLGSKKEGEVQEILEERASSAENKLAIIFDEYAAYVVDGAEVLLTQGRSLGFSVCISNQDYTGLMKANKGSAQIMAANTNTKFFGKTEDSEDTFELLRKSAGEMDISQVGGYEVDMDGMRGFKNNNSVNIKTVSRVSLLDLRAQKEGEMHMLFGDKIARMRFFYANPNLHKTNRLNEFVCIKSPSIDDLVKAHEDMSSLLDNLKNPLPDTDFYTSEDLITLFEARKQVAKTDLTPLEFGVATVYLYHKMMDIKINSGALSPVKLSSAIDNAGDDPSRDQSIDSFDMMFNGNLTQEQHAGLVNDQESLLYRNPGQEIINASISDENIKDVNSALTSLQVPEKDALNQSLGEINRLMNIQAGESKLSNQIESQTQYPVHKPDSIDSAEYLETIDMLNSALFDSDD